MEINEKQENYSLQPYKSEKKITAGILGILLGAFGVHKFYLGYTKAGIIQILLSLLCIGGIIGFIEELSI